MNVLRYSLVFLAVAVGVGLLVSVLNANSDSRLGSSAQLLVPAMIAALIEGQQFARKKKRKPMRGEMWNFVWLATAAAVALNVVLSYGLPQVLPEFAKLAVAPFLSKQFLILLGLYAGGYLVSNRIFAGIGSGNQLSLMRSRGEIE